MVTLARFSCAAGIHYHHDVQLIIDNRRCEERIAMARACLLALASVLQRKTALQPVQVPL